MTVGREQVERETYMACNEAIVRSLVGIAINQNQNIGTGTFVSFAGKQFVLTANHVIDNIDLSECRFFVPPPTPLIEHSMRSGLPKEFGLPSPGEFLSIGSAILRDVPNDIAALPLLSTTLIPDYIRFFPIESAIDPKDGLSVMVVGFPVANSAELGRSPGHEFRALGLTSEHGLYSASAQATRTLHSSFDPDRHFVLEYTRDSDGIAPSGFSGAAGWLISTSNSVFWNPEPILVGIFTRWHKKTTGHPDLLQPTRASVIKGLFATTK